MAVSKATITDRYDDSDNGSNLLSFNVTITNFDGEYVDLGWSVVKNVEISVKSGGVTGVKAHWGYSSGRLTIYAVSPDESVDLAVTVRGID